MYVICDVDLPLSQSIFCSGSYLDSVLLFANRFPSRSAVVFRDLCGKARPNDFQFIALLSSKALSSLLKKYSLIQKKSDSPESPSAVSSTREDVSLQSDLNSASDVRCQSAAAVELRSPSGLSD